MSAVGFCSRPRRECHGKSILRAPWPSTHEVFNALSTAQACSLAETSCGITARIARNPFAKFARRLYANHSVITAPVLGELQHDYALVSMCTALSLLIADHSDPRIPATQGTSWKSLIYQGKPNRQPLPESPLDQVQPTAATDYKRA